MNEWIDLIWFDLSLSLSLSLGRGFDVFLRKGQQLLRPAGQRPIGLHEWPRIALRLRRRPANVGGEHRLAPLLLDVIRGRTRPQTHPSARNSISVSYRCIFFSPLALDWIFCVDWLIFFSIRHFISSFCSSSQSHESISIHLHIWGLVGGGEESARKWHRNGWGIEWLPRKLPRNGSESAPLRPFPLVFDPFPPISTPPVHGKRNWPPMNTTRCGESFPQHLLPFQQSNRLPERCRDESSPFHARVTSTSSFQCVQNTFMNIPYHALLEKGGKNRL